METPAAAPSPAPEAKRPEPGRGLRIGAGALLVASAGFLLYLSHHHFEGGYDGAFWTLIAALVGLWGLVIAVGLYGLCLWASLTRPPQPDPPPGNG